LPFIFISHQSPMRAIVAASVILAFSKRVNASSRMTHWANVSFEPPTPARQPVHVPLVVWAQVLEHGTHGGRGYGALICLKENQRASGKSPIICFVERGLGQLEKRLRERP